MKLKIKLIALSENIVVCFEGWDTAQLFILSFFIFIC